MDRFICLDLGDKRIGIAVSDPFNTYALPLETYNRKNLKTDLAKISTVMKERFATAIVCGLPVNFDGTPSIQTERAKFFIDKLIENGYKVYTIDERCTSIEAEETLKSQGKSIQESKKFVDALAATSILESFLLEYNKNKK